VDGAGDAIDSAELEELAAAHDITVEPGDILVIRTGGGEFLSDHDGATWCGRFPGLSAAALPWLHERQVAAIAFDNGAVEVRPTRSTTGRPPPTRRSTRSRCGTWHADGEIWTWNGCPRPATGTSSMSSSSPPRRSRSPGPSGHRSPGRRAVSTPGGQLSCAGQVAVVTGASRGIGAAIALALAEHGADVACLATTAAGAEPTAAALRALGRKSIAVGCRVETARK